MGVTVIQAGWIGFLACRERAASPGERVGAWLSRYHVLLHMHLPVDSPPGGDLTGGKNQKISSLTLTDLEQSGGVLEATKVPSPAHPSGDGYKSRSSFTAPFTSGSGASLVLFTLGHPRHGQGDERGRGGEGAGWVGWPQGTSLLDDGGAANITGQAGPGCPQQRLAGVTPVTVLPGGIPRGPFREGFPGFFCLGRHHAVVGRLIF